MSNRHEHKPQEAGSGYGPFLEVLKDQMNQVAQECGLDLDKEEHRGYAFARWYASLLLEHDNSLDLDVDDVVLRGGGDLGIDVVIGDDTSKTLTLIQSKCRGLSRDRKQIDRADVDSFLLKHDQLIDDKYIERGKSAARELLGGYGQRFRDGWRIRFEFVTTGAVSPELRSIVESHQAKLAQAGTEVEYSIVDRDYLPQYVSRLRSVTSDIPDSLEFELPERYSFEFTDGPYKALVGIIKGNAIVDIYNRSQVKETLFALNIRNYLGDRSINKDVKKTANETPDKFFYFNNGITAVCKEYQVSGRKIVARKMQVINGAQTVGSLARANKNENLYVPFRLIETGEVATDSGINNDIIKSNNSQNPIRLSDFRANDPIQKALEREIQNLQNYDVVGKLVYQRKRSGKRKHANRAIDLQELAKIRYAFLYEPTLVHSDPKALWTLKTNSESPGVYESAFGIDGKLEDAWTREHVIEAVFAIAAHDWIREKARLEELESTSDPAATPVSFSRQRFHALSLMGVRIRSGLPHPSMKELLSDKAKFNEFLGKMWDDARRLLYDASVEVNNGKATMFALVRSPDRWKAMRQKFEFELRRSRRE